ncbi:TetR family transcriptional regulator [Streptomyces albus]|uniref:TetR/AcrR family transcriptional regulator n=1 Tax=Streptomyces TaxID=1883 RepID=UPI0004CD6340|nr:MULTISPECIES: TetR/AcrR family transcriptional regulator [Streptomyces]MDI6413253.1 TetR/AcrR family transcriptional regulator [Streptomyces albus]QID34582.1 TetR family transcriptional regulator [Streptomyces albus]
MQRLPSAERRKQLVEAAIRVMTRDGVAKATTRSICAEAGVSLSVFHYCFASKQELIEDVMETITAHSVTPVAARIQPTADVRESVRAALGTYWDHVLAHPEEHMLTYELTQYALRRPGFEYLARRQYEQYAAANRALLEHLCRDLGLVLLVPAGTLVRYLASMIDGLTLNHLVLGDAPGAAAVLDTLADQMVHMMRRAEPGEENAAPGDG